MSSSWQALEQIATVRLPDTSDSSKASTERKDQLQQGAYRETSSTSHRPCHPPTSYNEYVIAAQRLKGCISFIDVFKHGQPGLPSPMTWPLRATGYSYVSNSISRPKQSCETSFAIP